MNESRLSRTAGKMPWQIEPYKTTDKLVYVNDADGFNIIDGIRPQLAEMIVNAINKSHDERSPGYTSGVKPQPEA